MKTVWLLAPISFRVYYIDVNKIIIYAGVQIKLINMHERISVLHLILICVQ